MRYRVKDKQFDYPVYFHNGYVFNSKEEIIAHLASFHNIDYEGQDDKGNDITIYEKLRTLKTEKAKLDYLLEYGEWELELINKEDK